MNRAVLTSFTILCLLSISFLMGCKLSVKASTTWTVDDDGPANFSSIQEAINSLDVKDGDTILVRAGTYYENVTVNKSISLVGEDRDSTIVDGNETGSVIVIEANNVRVEGFTIRNSGTRSYDGGILVDHSVGNKISHNTIASNRDGIGLHFSSDNSISDNTIMDDKYGIVLYYSSNNVVSGNIITNNKYGIIFYYPSNNVVSGNIITNNDYGITLFDSSNNVVFHNNLVNNTQQVFSDNSINVWDDGVEGNYWSNYTGVDSNHDGIGGTPHIIDASNQDEHPLMGTFFDLNVTLERETYYVTTICNSTISEFRFEIGLETGNKIIRFNVTGKDGTVGFCRVAIPTELMNYPYIVLIGLEEIVPTFLDVSNETCSYLYFTYIHSSYTITIISSKTLYLYYELLDKHVKLQMDLYDLNATYYDLLNNYSTHLGNYSQLQESYRELNNSYQEHLSNYSKNVQNFRNLICIFAATTAIFIITTIYLSKHAHAGKTKVFEEPPRKGARSNVHTTIKQTRK